MITPQNDYLTPWLMEILLPGTSLWEPSIQLGNELRLSGPLVRSLLEIQNESRNLLSSTDRLVQVSRRSSTSSRSFFKVIPRLSTEKLLVVATVLLLQKYFETTR